MAAPTIGRRRSNPAAKGSVDWSHPLASNLSFAAWSAGGKYMSTAQATIGTNNLHASSAFGAATGAADNSSRSASFGVNDAAYLPLATTAGFSVMFAGYVPAPAATRYIVSYEFSGGGGNGWGIYTTASLISAYIVNTTPTYVDLAGGGGLGGFGHVVAGFTCSGSTMTGYRNGAVTASTALTSIRTTQNTNPLNFHSSAGNTGSSATNLNGLWIWQRCLSAGEVAQLTADPFCMLRY